MSETIRRFDPDFKDGAVRIVVETGKSIAQVARELGIILSFLVGRACDLGLAVEDGVYDATT